MTRSICSTLVALSLALAGMAQGKGPYQYSHVGATADVTVKTQAGFALMGGGTDLDEAFRWLCGRANGGDFLVLRAAGTDAYNPYVAGLEDGKNCKLNSVATLVIPSREAAGDRFVAETIRHAEAIFIAGGDQSNYVRFWMGTPVQAEINAAIKRGVPLGGTSAGLAVMGEWVYSAEGEKPGDPNLDSKTALMNPLGPRITLAHGFLEIPVLKGIITDTHFAKRDRMGRLLVFLSQIGSSNIDIRGLGIQEKASVLLEPDGHARVVGNGDAYLVSPTPPSVALAAGKPLTSATFHVQKIVSGKSFDLAAGKSDSPAYTLTIDGGELRSSQPGNEVY